MLDTEGKPFNQRLELSEVSLRKSQKKLQSLIYKDRAQLSEPAESSCLSSVLSDGRSIKRHRFEEKSLDADFQVGSYRPKFRRGESGNSQVVAQAELGEPEANFDFVSELERDEVVEDNSESSAQEEYEFNSRSSRDREKWSRHEADRELYEGGPDFCSLQD